MIIPAITASKINRELRNPTIPHPDYAGKTGKGKWADQLHQIDEYTGMLLDAIDDIGIRDNTIFIFTADNVRTRGGPM